MTSAYDPARRTQPFIMPSIMRRGYDLYVRRVDKAPDAELSMQDRAMLSSAYMYEGKDYRLINRMVDDPHIFEARLQRREDGPHDSQHSTDRLHAIRPEPRRANTDTDGAASLHAQAVLEPSGFIRLAKDSPRAGPTMVVFAPGRHGPSGVCATLHGAAALVEASRLLNDARMRKASDAAATTDARGEQDTASGL